MFSHVLARTVTCALGLPGADRSVCSGLGKLGAALALVAAINLGELCAGAEFRKHDPKQIFKELLSNPPAFERVLFREKLPPVFNQPVPMDVGVKLSTNYAFYELRFQTNALLVRSLSSTNDLGTAKIGNVAFTLWNDDFCFLDAGTNAFIYRLEHERARRGDVPPSYDAAWFRVTRYAEILNLGLSHLWPGTVRWSGDTFLAHGIADKKPMLVTGRISGLTNGIPCELEVTYSNNVGVARYRIAYDYGRYEAPYYPTSIRLLFKGPPREIEYRTYELLSIRTASRALPESIFSPAQFLREKSISLRYLTNNSTYMRLPSGRFLETPGAGVKLSLTKHEYYQNRYAYLALALVSMLFLCLSLKTGAREQNEKGKE